MIEKLSFPATSYWCPPLLFKKIYFQEHMTNPSRDSKNSGIPLVTSTTSTRISLLVATSKDKPLCTASAMAKLDRSKATISAQSSRRHLPNAIPARSAPSGRQPPSRQWSISLFPNNPEDNINYDTVMQNLNNLATYIRTKRPRQDPDLVDDTTSHFPEAIGRLLTYWFHPKEATLVHNV